MTPIIFEFTPNKTTNIINAFNNREKIFAAMKHTDIHYKIITIEGKIFEHPSRFSDGNEC